MWKFVSRRIRDTFERNANKFEKRSSAGIVISSPDEKNKRCTPQFRWFPPQTCWQTCKHNKDTNSNRWNFDYLNRSWIGAITWSSALVLGWYTSQLLHLKCKYRANKGHEKICPSINNVLKALRPYVAAINEDAICANSAPTIDKIVNNFTPNVHLISNDQYGTRKEDDSASSSKASPDTSNSDFGDVLNSIENKLGLSAIESGHHQDGLKLLRSAAHRHYAPALYNLALCYETGVGVSVDEKMAMELYKSAAALEHPGALYNLSIYYGQGRGGLSCDCETATRLLRLAAMKGQQDAIKALKEEFNTDIGEPSHNINTEESRTFSQRFPQNKNVVPMPTTLFVENASLLQIPHCETPVY